MLPPSTWTGQHQGAECLYLILSGIREGDKGGLEFFKETEIGDVDGDGMPEVLDAWGNPIEFLRWAPGFSVGVGPDGNWGVAGVDDDGDSTTDNIEERGAAGSDDQLISDLNIPNHADSPDSFDPLYVDDDLRAFYGVPVRVTFAQYPLIYSAGRDRQYDIFSDLGTSFSYSAATYPVDPYYVIPPATSMLPTEVQFGFPVDANGDGETNHLDNITNHLLETDI
jgi:hypothetical protein